MIEYDDPVVLARQVTLLDRPLLIGLDVDGVLAPIVHHADHARLTVGVAELVSELAGHDQLHIAIVSGRSIGDLSRFDFDKRATLVGSHGMEMQGRPMEPLDDQEKARLAQLTDLAEQAMNRAGNGAWVETKPASVVLHVRQADSVTGADALEWLEPRAVSVEGADIKAGSAVLELFTRAGNKGRAMSFLRAEVNAAAALFVGDDKTDEEAFAALNASDMAVKVGDAPTLAGNRLHDPDAVRDWLRELVIQFR